MSRVCHRENQWLACERWTGSFLRRGWLKELMSITLCGLACFHASHASTVVRYPQQESANGYPLQVLRLALDQSNVAYELQPSKTPMPQGRALEQLSSGVNVDVVWSMTSKRREEILHAIRIPIDKGLLGWRLFLVNKNRAAEFSKVRTLDDLKRFQAGQGHDWPDTEILRFSGLGVQSSATYRSLFKMLRAGRFDYFPRSVIEIWEEAQSLSDTDVIVEKTVLLHYPTAFYFFVSKDNQRLARAIEMGLNTAIANGQFERLFQRTYGDILQRANVRSRTILRIPNPLLPVDTPLGRKDLWIDF